MHGADHATNAASTWKQAAAERGSMLCAGLLFAAMAVVSFVGVMPASFVADKLGRKWTIVPSCLGLAGALLLMAVTGAHPTTPISDQGGSAVV